MNILKSQYPSKLTVLNHNKWNFSEFDAREVPQYDFHSQTAPPTMTCGSVKRDLLQRLKRPTILKHHSPPNYDCKGGSPRGPGARESRQSAPAFSPRPATNPCQKRPITEAKEAKSSSILTPSCHKSEKVSDLVAFNMSTSLHRVRHYIGYF